MKSLRDEFWKRMGAGAILALLAAFLLAPRSAEAGCDDSASQHSWSVSRLDSLIRGESPVHATDSHDEQPPDHDGLPACSGPSCSGNVPPPVSAGFTSLDFGRGDSLIARLVVPPSVSGSRMFHVLEEPLDSARLASRVFHPPRSTV